MVVEIVGLEVVSPFMDGGGLTVAACYIEDVAGEAVVRGFRSFAGGGVVGGGVVGVCC